MGACGSNHGKLVADPCAPKVGWRAGLLPKRAPIFKTVLENLLDHRQVKTMMDKARSSFDKTIIGTDGSYKTLLGVLYQTPHGARQVERGSTNTVADNAL